MTADKIKYKLELGGGHKK